MAEGDSALARALSDGEDNLIAADEPLAGLQRRCGGDLPGAIAVPELRELVIRARRFGMKLARPIAAQDGEHSIAAWIEIEPRGNGEAGCAITVRDWQTSDLPAAAESESDTNRTAIDRDLAELTAQLDDGQRLLTVSAQAPDMGELLAAMSAGAGHHWAEFVAIAGSDAAPPRHWRLLDGARLAVPGSDRVWRASLDPQRLPGRDPHGFTLYLVAETPLPEPAPPEAKPPATAAIGRDIAPVLRQPIARIMANAETIRTRLAGPLDEAYAGYAGDIADAAKHLLALIEDLSALEVVEADDFTAAPDRIDLAEVARQAAGILGVRAREQGIVVDPPKAGETMPAIGEFRRVLQVLLNLLGNAIRYAPPGSQVWIRLDRLDGMVRATVADQGPGLSDNEQARVFEKFERLGRSGDGGSGLGLYISRRLARAMGGDLTVDSAPGQGARFMLDLPEDAGKPV